MAAFGVVWAVHQDTCHTKMDTAFRTDRLQLISQQTQDAVEMKYGLLGEVELTAGQLAALLYLELAFVKYICGWFLNYTPMDVKSV